MKAVVRDGDAPAVVDRPRPEPGQGEVLVQVYRVGIDGTDREVLAGSHGGLPDSAVLGHEAVGEVTDPNGTRFETGETVVPTVRRPPDTSNEWFERGEPDMAPPEATLECGISGSDGFMAECISVPEQFLVRVPERLAPYGFLVEPLSVTVKALELAEASRASFTWSRDSALVLGPGSLGLLTIPVLAREFDRVYCLGRRDRDDPRVRLARALDATYIDSRETAVPEIPDAYEPMDLVYEATGHAPHAIESVATLAQNGVAALLGVPEGHISEFDAGRFHRELVVGNRAVVGSVNAGRDHFERAVELLDTLPARLLDAYTDDVYPAAAVTEAFAADVMKTAVEFDV